MRKPILVESRNEEQEWPRENINQAIDYLYNYLSIYYHPEQYGYTKYAIMGPIGKLLPTLLSEQFGDTVESYVGYVVNIHSHESVKKHLGVDGFEQLKKGIATIIEIKNSVTPRNFQKIIRSIDYGIFYKKSEEIAQIIEYKKKTKVKSDNSLPDLKNNHESKKAIS
jgi:hypothetical protein